jgi:phosphonate transport system substrate-binding protein
MSTQPQFSPSLSRRLLGRGVLALLAGALAGCSSKSSEAAPRTLYFTAIPNQNTTELEAKFQPLAAHLTQELGFPVAYRPSADYAASVELFKNGDAHLSWFGGYTGVQARRAVPGARAIAQGKVDPQFKSYFIANASTGVERSEQFPLGLAGRSFTFGSPSSTSGRLMPEFFLRAETGKTPEEFFGSAPLFSKGHDITATQVQNGEVECGALDYTVYDSLVQKGTIDPEVARIVWVTPPYADYNWTVHPEVDALFGTGTTQRLQRALLELDEPELLAAIGRPDGLIEADNGDYASIEEIAVELGLVR